MAGMKLDKRLQRMVTFLKNGNNKRMVTFKTLLLLLNIRL